MLHQKRDASHKHSFSRLALLNPEQFRLVQREGDTAPDGNTPSSVADRQVNICALMSTAAKGCLLALESELFILAQKFLVM
jgi:hypothetical protein